MTMSVSARLPDPQARVMSAWSNELFLFRYYAINLYNLEEMVKSNCRFSKLP